MTIIAVLDSEGFISHTRGAPDPPDMQGPILPPGEGEALLVERVVFSQAPSPTARARPLSNGRVEWVETGELDRLKASAIARTYVDVDAVYASAVGNRTPEYAEAEAAARAYLAADPKPAAISEFITDHAQDNPTGQVQTNDWAAQQIVEKADVLRWAVRQMRKVRFARQAAMRASTTPEELAEAVGAWGDFIAWLRTTLGL